MSSTWVNALLAATSLVVGAIFLRTAARRSHERLPCLAPALMGIGMAGMFSPWGDPVPATAGTLVFVVIAAWFGAQALRTGRLRLTESVHLVVGPAAMVLMYQTMGATTAGSDVTEMADPAHAGHSMTMGGSGGGSPLLSALALALIGYFVWYAWILAGRLPQTTAPASDGAAVVVRTRVTTVQVVIGAHVVMCVLMAVMFLGSV